MKNKIIVSASVVIAILGALILYHLYGDSSVPSGQQLLVRLNTSNVASLRAAFNESANSVRLLVLLSPT